MLRLGIGVLLAAAVAGVYVSPVRDRLTIDNIRAMLAHVNSLWYGPLAFIGIYAIAVVLWMPASLFILAAGVIWGWFLGGSYALAGGLLGAFIAYRLGHFLGGDLLARFGRPGAIVAKRLDHAGFSTLLTLRLIPVFPFSLLNYGAGVAGIRARDFVLATIVGLSPSNFVLAYSADAIVGGTLTKGAAFQRIGIALGLVALLFILTAIVKRRAQRLLVPEQE